MSKLKGQKIVSCRICKGDHWTTRCPYKDTLGPMQKELAEQLGLSTGEKEKLPGGGGQRLHGCGVHTDYAPQVLEQGLLVACWLWVALWSRVGTLGHEALAWPDTLLLLGLQSWSPCRPPRTRLASTCRQACGTAPAAGANPCSPTAEVRGPGRAGPGPWAWAGTPGPLTLNTCHTADDNATIRVTNLSEDTRETDLQELFRPFGSISRIYLAKDKTTGQSKVGGRPWGTGCGVWGRCGPDSPLSPGLRLHQLPPP